MKDEALKQALEALENSVDQLAKPYSTGAQQAITAIKQALEAPVQEPVAWRVKWPAIGGGHKWIMLDKPLLEKEGFVNQALYTTPPAQPAPVQEPVAWEERWYGSGQERGWWIWERHSLTHGQAVAWIGSSPFAERLTSLIVEKHNAASFPTEPVKERFAPDPHNGTGPTPPAAQPAKEKAPQSANCEAPGRISSDHARDADYKADQPVAVVSGYYGGQCVVLPTDPARLFNSGTAFYTTPPAQRQWVGLTEEEHTQIVVEASGWNNPTSGFFSVARAIEAKLKEKNT
jgi:hypothetical protein